MARFIGILTIMMLLAPQTQAIDCGETTCTVDDVKDSVYIDKVQSTEPPTSLMQLAAVVNRGIKPSWNEVQQEALHNRPRQRFTKWFPKADGSTKSTPEEDLSSKLRTSMDLMQSNSTFDELLSRSLASFAEQVKSGEFCWKQTKDRGGSIDVSECQDGYDPVKFVGLFPACVHSKVDMFKCPEGWSVIGPYCKVPSMRSPGFLSKTECEKSHETDDCEFDPLHQGTIDLHFIKIEHKSRLGWWVPPCPVDFPVRSTEMIGNLGASYCLKLEGGHRKVTDKYCEEQVGSASWKSGPDECSQRMLPDYLAPQAKYQACFADGEHPNLAVGRCWKNCEDGWTGVIGQCWQNADADEGWVNCGMGNAKSRDICNNIMHDQVWSFISMVVKLATLGTGHAGMEGMESIASMVEEGEKISGAISTLWTGLTELSNGHMAEGGSKLGEGVEMAVAGSKIVQGVNDIKNAECFEDQVRGAGNILKKIDPTGIAGVVGAFSYPTCDTDGIPMVQDWFNGPHQGAEHDGGEDRPQRRMAYQGGSHDDGDGMDLLKPEGYQVSSQRRLTHVNGDTHEGLEHNRLILGVRG